MSVLSYDLIQNAFIKWGQACDDIQALIVVGSRARTTPAADEWSDLDLIAFTNSVEKHRNRDSWFGDVKFFFWDETDDSSPEVFILYENGLKVDVVFWKLDRLMSHEVFKRGVKVLLDKNDLLDNLSMSSEIAQASPTQHEFNQVLHKFWYSVLYMAKQLWRGELWMAKQRDYAVKQYLLQMITWHTDHNIDTWYGGRFIDRWADKRIIVSLDAVFGHYDPDDSWRALQATMDLFRWVAIEVGKRFNYPYLVSIDDYVIDLVEKLQQKAK